MTTITDLIARHIQRLPTVARIYYTGIGARRYKRASTRSGPGEPLVFKDLAERELRAAYAEMREQIETLQRERDEAVRDAERARQDRAHVGVEIRREWMTKCAELQWDAERYKFLRRRAVMVDYSDDVATKLTLFKDEGPTGEFLDDWVDGEIAAIKSGSEG
jgi:hypothetical protein